MDMQDYQVKTTANIHLDMKSQTVTFSKSLVMYKESMQQDFLKQDSYLLKKILMISKILRQTLFLKSKISKRDFLILILLHHQMNVYKKILINFLS